MDIAGALERAQQLHDMNQLEEAERIYRAALVADSNCADALYGLGTIYLQRQQYSESQDYLLRAVELEPAPEFLVNLGMAEESLQRPREAATNYLRAASLAPEDEAILQRVSQRLLHLGCEREVMKLLAGRAEPPLLILYARAAAKLGDWSGALATLQELLRSNPESPENWRELATAAARLRDYPTALAAYRRYLASRQPGDDTGQALLAFADLLLLARQPQELRDFLSEHQSKLPATSQALLLQAKLARLEGSEAEVLQHLLTAIELEPSNGEAWQMRLEFDREIGPEALAQQCQTLAAGSEAAPRDSALLEFTAGRAWEACGHFSAAFACFQRGNEIQCRQLAARKCGYDPAATEASMARIRSLFAGKVASAEAQTPQPIFILGMPRSGTTLVERLLGEHAGVSTGGENEAMEFLAARYYWDLENGNQPPPQEAGAEYWAKLAADYWRRSSSEPQRLTDKMPHNFRHIGLIRALFPAAPIIYLRRDPRDVCLSIFSRSFPDGHSYACDLNWLVHFYHQSCVMMRFWMERFPGQIMQVNYRDLIETPQQQSREIAEFCSLEWNPHCLDFHKTHGASFTFSELQVRKPINREGLDRWRHYERELAPLIHSLRACGEIE